MRLLSVVFIVLISFSARSQSFEGGYVPGNQAAAVQEGYYFWETGQFDWFRTSKSEKKYGNGHYTINGDSIQLEFETARRHFDLQLNESQTNPSGDCIIEVRAIRSNGTPFQGLTTILRRSNITHDTDHRGISRIEIHKPLPDDEILIELNGYLTPGRPIKLQGFNHIFGIVIDETLKYRDNEVISLFFKRTSRKLRLAHTILKKISQKKFLALYGSE